MIRLRYAFGGLLVGGLVFQACKDTESILPDSKTAAQGGYGGAGGPIAAGGGGTPAGGSSTGGNAGMAGGAGAGAGGSGGSGGAGGSGDAGSAGAGAAGASSAGAAGAAQGGAGGASGAGAGGGGGGAVCGQGLHLCQGDCHEASDPACLGKVVTLGDAIQSTIQLPTPKPDQVADFGLVVDDLDQIGEVDTISLLRDYQGGVFSGRIMVLHINKDGTFVQTPTWNAKIPAIATYLQVRDLDGDGKLDVSVSVVPDQQRVYLRKNGTFLALPSFTTVPKAGCPWMADLDGDGRPDLLCALGEPGAITGLRPMFGNGDGTFTAGADTTMPLASYSLWRGVLRGPALGREVVVDGSALNLTHLLRMGSKTSPVIVKQLDIGASTGSPGLLVDLVGQGIGQFLAPQDTGHLTVHRFDPKNLDGPPTKVNDVDVGFSDYFDVDAGDVNGDGRKDLLFSKGGGAKLFQQIPDGTMVPTLQLGPNTPGIHYQATLRDVNGDGLPDVIFPRTATVLLNTTK